MARKRQPDHFPTFDDLIVPTLSALKKLGVEENVSLKADWFSHL
jgi:hypothetical protein